MRKGLLIVTSLILILYISLTCIHSRQSPGLVWKISYSDHPELQDIYDAFVESCVDPGIPESYLEDVSVHSIYQEIRDETKSMSLSSQDKFLSFELDQVSAWKVGVSDFYSTQQYKASNADYRPRLGCYIREVSNTLETFAVNKMNDMMERLHMTNRLGRLTDSRGSTYMPPGGFMETHTNREHLAGWRLYMHYLPPTRGFSSKGEFSGGGQTSKFSYRHPFDHSVRTIVDTNNGANMFRIRVPPEDVMWHGIWADRPRYSWGLWLPPEVAQFLKVGSIRV